MTSFANTMTSFACTMTSCAHTMTSFACYDKFCIHYDKFCIHYDKLCTHYDELCTLYDELPGSPYASCMHVVLAKYVHALCRFCRLKMPGTCIVCRAQCHRGPSGMKMEVQGTHRSLAKRARDACSLRTKGLGHTR